MLSREEKQEIAKLYCVKEVLTVNDTDFIVMPLAYHLALVLNPTRTGYEQRYCYENLERITKALREFKEGAELRYWHKDHTKGLSVACGNLLFKPGTLHQKGEECGTVDWTV